MQDVDGLERGVARAVQPGADVELELDPQGSLMDADMGAYYTWLNQQRLSGAEQATFLVWFEDHPEAMAIGPGFDRGKESEEPIALRDLIARVA